MPTPVQKRTCNHAETKVVITTPACKLNLRRKHTIARVGVVMGTPLRSGRHSLQLDMEDGSPNPEMYKRPETVQVVLEQNVLIPANVQMFDTCIPRDTNSTNMKGVIVDVSRAAGVGVPPTGLAQFLVTWIGSGLPPHWELFSDLRVTHHYTDPVLPPP